ncbi:carbohydrate ABC transporter permease [Demequina sp. NBRC 110057]|uniref:carbohydrate ABC transporter permease n=1 Tax=Demequina sp. NBRC 110057 TaxID=1570346 RepID=UPI001F288BC6|nr:carbohydrate ABC transporter permease [Demequina sp. NBRC 110057]
MRFLGKTVMWAAIAVAMVIALFPFYWMLRTSISPQEDVYLSGMSLLPDGFTLDAYGRAWTDGGLGHAMLVGAIVTGAILGIQLLTCLPAAYVLSKVHSRWTAIVLGVILASVLIPAQVTLVPTFIGINLAGLGDSMAGLILPFITSAFGIFLLRQQMMSIPTALMEAARTDGLGHVRTLVTIVTPLCAPGIAAFSVFTVFATWNEYLWPLLVARSPELRTPPLALAVFQSADAGFDYAALAAGAVIVTAPVVLLFLFAQKRFVQGMSGTEVAG